jgi:hypothetical protein
VRHLLYETTGVVSVPLIENKWGASFATGFFQIGPKPLGGQADPLAEFPAFPIRDGVVSKLLSDAT